MFFKKQNNEDNETDWLPISDLMSGLMVIFILIMISSIYQLMISQSDNNILEKLFQEISDLKTKNKDLTDQVAKLNNKNLQLEEKLQEAENKIYKSFEYINQIETELKKYKFQTDIANEIKSKILTLANSVNMTEQKLAEKLRQEFKHDLKRWNAEILDDATIKFNSPDILFEISKSELKSEFKDILRNFFPRYIRVLRDVEAIAEVRIEGHTSPEWHGINNKKEAFIKNSELSQARAYQVLSFSLNLPSVDNNFEWLKTKLRANGLSSSQPIYENGIENYNASRRVEIKAIPESRKSLDEINSEIEKLNKLIK
jgi:outer membrane protein OmpA-like peptidoglycan-associated protein